MPYKMLFYSMLFNIYKCKYWELLCWIHLRHKLIWSSETTEIIFHFLWKWIWRFTLQRMYSYLLWFSKAFCQNSEKKTIRDKDWFTLDVSVENSGTPLQIYTVNRQAADHRGQLKVRPVSYPLTNLPLTDGVYSKGNERGQVEVWNVI